VARLNSAVSDEFLCSLGMSRPLKLKRQPAAVDFFFREAVRQDRGPLAVSTLPSGNATVMKPDRQRVLHACRTANDPRRNSLPTVPMGRFLAGSGEGQHR